MIPYIVKKSYLLVKVSMKSCLDEQYTRVRVRMTPDNYCHASAVQCTRNVSTKELVSS